VIYILLAPSAIVAGKEHPPFEALPLRPNDPPFSAWSLYGPDDELGRLNLLTPERVLAAKAEILTGESLSLKYV
jgi:hypothetical protein